MGVIGRLDWMHVFIDVPASAAADTRGFWSQTLGWPPGSPWPGHPEFTSLVPPEGDSYVHVQEVGDDRRVHLDVVVDSLEGARAYAARLGAGTGARGDGWQVMSSPGVLPFCLCTEPASGARRPPGTRHDDGHRSRLVQVCIDIPAREHDRELAFWRQLTGWACSRSGRPEFADLVGPARAPLRLLVQRLGADDQGAATRAHIDLGSDDIDGEAARLVGLGARYVERFDGWAVMVDPAGLVFCVTGKPPD
jgi:predicted enzyme related to lactoylglutathione lyase